MNGMPPRAGCRCVYMCHPCGRQRPRPWIAGAGNDLKFILVDSLVSLDPGKRVVMTKNVTMAEEYLADHFPNFPVLPGVMMLESAVQAAAWLVRVTTRFSHALVVLKEARGVRYGNFVAPGQTLTVTVDAVEITARGGDFKIKGTLPNGATAITARIELAALNLADTDPALKNIDQIALAAQKERWQTLLQGSPAGAATSALSS
jgi:3-hydroxyacyl-[acyl-carrier-protein] dehydratase